MTVVYLYIYLFICLFIYLFIIFNFLIFEMYGIASLAIYPIGVNHRAFKVCQKIGSF